MGFLAWIISIAAFFGGLAVRTDIVPPLSVDLSWGLFAASAFACPPLWRETGLSALLSGRQRAMACLALLLALPLALIPAA